MSCGDSSAKAILRSGIFVNSFRGRVRSHEMHSGLVQLAYAYFDGATTAAGSTINQNIPAEQLSVARARQRNIEGWKRPVKIRKD
ncbi:hypothetical protein ALQ27_200113 [Pseudomonas syringae pv. delphinii]|nr:hypothetical protein ALO72_200288 [Pseudomonas syringae pv. delphinii]RMP19151.1 hypothetical protein ALQ27_200113 [Pseudomonas syringae pv. delphinii]